MKAKLFQEVKVAIVLLCCVLPTMLQAQDMAFGGMEVTKSNCNNLITAFKDHYTQIGIWGGAFCKASGSVTYDFSTNTLTLNEANITLTVNPSSIDGVVFNVRLDKLTVNLIGHNVINSGTAAFHQSRNASSGKDPELIFTGSGTLKINNKGTRNSRYAGINLYTDGKMVVNCKELNVFSNWGIAIGAVFQYNSYGRSTLSVGNNSALIAKAKGGSIAQINNFSKGSNCLFHKPQNAYFDYRKKAICDALGQVITDEVVCASYNWIPTSVASVTTNILTQQNIYSLQGVLIPEKFESLPKGIYIVNGKKIVKN